MKAPESLFPHSIRCDASYALKTGGGWLGFAVLLTMLNIVMDHSDRTLLILMRDNLILVACCALGTHLVRMLIISAGDRASWRIINVRAFLVGVPLFSLMMSILLMEIGAITAPDTFMRHKQSFFDALMGLWFFMAILFAGWTGVYVSAKAIQKSGQAEMEKLRFAAALREAELRALKAQINPHFLFNSLNTIRALVNDRPDKAQSAVLHLSLLLRAALQSDNMLRSLRDEMDTAQHYLELEQLRFEERLRVKTDISPDTLEVPIPTMMVQTLVENAVKHGIANSVNGGELAITSRIEDKRCILSITNPGRLRQPGEGTGLGLRNARMRITRLLGEDSSLLLEERDGLVVATLNIPSKPDDRSSNS
jgi:two-component sensor histidine kinase